nr:gustatory receptor 33.3 [Papilio glaucus]
MRIVETLRKFFFLGNLLLLFPNLFIMNKGKRVLIYFAILAEILITLTNGVICAYYKLYHHFSDIIYFNLFILNSILLILLTCYHSERYKIMFTFLDTNHNFVTKDDMYLKNFEKKKKILLATFVSYVVLEAILPLVKTRYFDIQGHGLPVFVSTILAINSTIYNFRVFFSFYIFYVLLYLISEQLECMIRSTVKEKHLVATVSERTEAIELDDAMARQYKNIISQWSDVFAFITEAINIFNKIFSLQMTLMFSSAIICITLLLYDIAVISSKNLFDNFILTTYFIKVMTTHAQIFVLSKAGQRVHNNVENLKRRVGKLLMRSLTNMQFYGATKDLLQHISTGRTKIQAFGAINIDMTLTPTFIMLYTSYTVIALQFNNVL